MSELTLILLRLGFLALLWIFVLIRDRRDALATCSARESPAGRTRQARGASRPPSPPKPAKPKARPQGHRTHARVVEGRSPARRSAGHRADHHRPRADSTLVLDDDYASNRHARISPHEAGWFVEDLGSTNGTYVERTRITEPTRVPLGTPVRIGKTILELRK